MLNLGKIDHIHVRVTDTPTAVEWYQRVLGLTPDPRYRHMQEEPHGVTMVANPSASVRLALCEDADFSAAVSAVAFVVSGQEFMEWIDQLAGERVTNREGQTIARDSVYDHHFFCSLAFVDPFGNAFEVVSYDHTWLTGKLKLTGRNNHNGQNGHAINGHNGHNILNGHNGHNGHVPTASE
ncbi:glyoxalase/bleomycin resistance protein/dioxygenase [Pseudogulbenkiania sp. NH8B]|uniref:VOC family protein n=1 Tax=Pseudogulbenkiania sp. (strain NH8B) TaxID=748280 RepID=UPI0002279E49|nr:VOC family protein [Pseudogulbenkiania sp. NH8B]BAK76097.1 glyoxalase/bleomycin resistance protein/dioxygenase [Pseudogulbenkiania sp. NH8B]